MSSQIDCKPDQVFSFPSPPSISQALSAFRLKGTFCDAVLNLHSCQIWVHRVVIAAASPFFAGLCNPLKKSQTFDIPSEITDKSMTLIIDWMYKEENGNFLDLDNQPQNLNIFQAVKILKITELCEFFERFKDEVISENVNEKLRKEDELNVKVEVETLINTEQEMEILPDDKDVSCKYKEKRKQKRKILNDFPKVKTKPRSYDKRLDFLRLSGLETDDPILNPLINKNKSGYQFHCPHCAFQINQKSVRYKRDKGKTLYISSAEHLYEEHDITCPKVIFLCPTKNCGVVKFGKQNMKNHILRGRHGLNSITTDPVLITYIDKKVFVCKHCDFCETFSAKSLVTCARHLKEKHEIMCPSIWLPCPIGGCEYLAYSKSRLEIHISFHLNKPSLIPCTLCGKMLAQNSMKAHLINVHGNEFFECPVCKKKFKSSDSVKRHEISQHSNTPIMKKNSCTICDYRSKGKSELREHMHRKHGMINGKLQRCPDCTYSTTQSSALRRHREIHLNEKSECPQCKQVFKNERYMKRHLNFVHHSKHDSPCPECAQLFKSKTGLMYHRWKVHHKGKNGLNEDNENNRIEKPFKCKYCEHTSGLPGNLRKHIMNIHKDLPIEYLDLRTDN